MTRSSLCRVLALLSLVAVACSHPAGKLDALRRQVPGSLAAPVSAVPVVVAAVIDGDTVRVRLSHGLTTVRLLGLDTPETKDPRKPVQCFGPQASSEAKHLLSGATVRLAGDPSQDAHDKYGRLLAYLWLPDGTLYDWLMIRAGYAREYTYAEPYAYQRQFRAAQATARAEHLGLWSPSTCDGGTSAVAAARSPPAVIGAATTGAGTRSIPGPRSRWERAMR